MASTAAAAGSAAAAAAAAAVPTLSAVVRRLLVDAGNRPVRVNALWDAVRAQPSAASTSKTHFKRRILGQMLVRDEVRALTERLRAAPRCAGVLERPPTSHCTHTPSPTYPPLLRNLCRCPALQLVKLRVPEELAAGKAPGAPLSRAATAAAAANANLVYAYRLKGSAKVNLLLKREGLPDIRVGGRRRTAAETAAAAAAAPAAAAAAEPPLR